MDYEYFNARYRLRMREPAILVPEDRLPRQLVTYYADTPTILNKKEVMVSNSLGTPTQTIVVDQQKMADSGNKSQRNLLLATLAAIAGYFILTQE